MTRKQRRLAPIGTSLAVLASPQRSLSACWIRSFFSIRRPMSPKNTLRPAPACAIGGLVKTGSIERGANLLVRFAVTDGKNDLAVRYQGIVPDLFREGQGVVAEGKLDTGGVFTADTVSPNTMNATCRVRLLMR